VLFQYHICDYGAKVARKGLRSGAKDAQNLTNWRGFKLGTRIALGVGCNTQTNTSKGARMKIEKINIVKMEDGTFTPVVFKYGCGDTGFSFQTIRAAWEDSVDRLGYTGPVDLKDRNTGNWHKLR
jgi:hypothetical protein